MMFTWEKTILDFIKKTDFSAIPVGKYTLADAIYYMVQEYVPKPMGNIRWEAHKAYFDLQYVLSGSEAMGVGNVEKMAITEAYNPDKDVLFLDGVGGEMRVYHSGDYAIFAPSDAHAPGMQLAGQCGAVRKLVFKIPAQMV